VDAESVPPRRPSFIAVHCEHIAFFSGAPAFARRKRRALPTYDRGSDAESLGGLAPTGSRAGHGAALPDRLGRSGRWSTNDRLGESPPVAFDVRRRNLWAHEELVAPHALHDLIPRSSRVRERRQQRHHARRLAPRELAAFPLVDPAVDTGLDVVDPELRSEPGEPREQRRVQDALAAKCGMQ
jgi:hypothetical protein